MKEKITSTESASTVCYEAMEAQARSCIQSWLQDLLEAEVTEFLGRGKSQRRAELEPARLGYRNGYGVVPASSRYRAFNRNDGRDQSWDCFFGRVRSEVDDSDWPRPTVFERVGMRRRRSAVGREAPVSRRAESNPKHSEAALTIAAIAQR